jgi:hypothetical protein
MPTPNKLFEPISIAVPIVDHQGRPTPQFQRLIQRLSVGAMLQVGPDGTISIASGGITNDLLAPDAVTSSKILDGTIATVDIADAAITNAKLANMAAHLIKARKTNSTGVPEDATLSEVLDFLSSTQGVIFYRGASGWAALAPGTSGQFLKTQGAAADPVWASVTAGTSKAATDNTLGAASTSLHCAKGALIIPLTDIVVYGAWFRVDEINTGVYRAGLYEIGGTNTITTVMGTSATQTAAATAAKLRYFPFSAGLTMTKGLRYALLHIRTDATATTSSGCYGGSGDAKGVPVEIGATFLQYDKTAPTVGDTVAASGVNPHYHGFSYSIS